MAFGFYDYAYCNYRGSIARGSNAGTYYVDYSEVDFGVFRARHLVPISVKFGRMTAYGTQKPANFCETWEYKLPAWAYSLRDLFEIFRVCGNFHDRLFF